MVVVVAGVVLGIVALLAVPVAAEFHVEGVEPLRGRLAVRWLFGLVRVRVALPRARKRRAAEAEAGDGAARGRKRRERRRGRRSRPARIGAALRRPEFRRRAIRFLEDLVRAAHLDGLRLRMRLGLGDPADTGLLWALAGQLGAVARGLRGAEVRIEPEFVEAALDLQADGRLRVVPLRLTALIVAFALSPPSIRAWRTLAGHA